MSALVRGIHISCVFSSIFLCNRANPCRGKGILEEQDVFLPVRDIDTGLALRDTSAAWEEEYTRKGAVWGGSVHHLPPLPPGVRVLELGCGNGKSLSAMIGRNWEVTAIDLSLCALAMSRMHTGMREGGDTCAADARALPFASESFDAVCAVHIFSHLLKEDRLTAVAEAVRVLKKSGILYFSGFSTQDFRYSHGTPVEEGTVMRGSGICTHYFTQAETQELFCSLTPAAMITRQWLLRVRGQEFCRAEIQATFIR
jgi:SAM-dependent methyltransferase